MTASSPQELYLGARVSGDFTVLGQEARRRHLYIVGQTGTGKSTLLLNLIAQDIAAGEGLALLDPHGDLAEAVLEHIPRHHTGRFVYLNPADAERPIGFNPLSAVPEDLKPIVADGVVSAFRHVWPESWGPRLDYILTNAVRALLDVPGGTLLMLPRLLIDEPFRVRLVDGHVRDPLVRSFWLNEYAGYGDHFRAEAISPIQNKIGKALIEPRLRNMLSQPSSTITLRRLMDEGAIGVCNLAKGRLGEGVSHLLGALLTTSIAQAALSRADVPAAERRVFHLYADEFQSFATESFALILSEARKYGLTLTIAHQYLDQVPERLRAAVFGNVGSLIACRTGVTDAAILTEQIGLGVPDALLDLPNFTAWARLLLSGVPSSPTRFKLQDAPIAPYPDPHRRIEASARRFGRPRADVERRNSQLSCLLTGRSSRSLAHGYGTGYAHGYSDGYRIHPPYPFAMRFKPLIYLSDFKVSRVGSGRDLGCLLVGVFVFRKAVSSNEFGGEKMLVGLASRPRPKAPGARSRPW